MTCHQANGKAVDEPGNDEHSLFLYSTHQDGADNENTASDEHGVSTAETITDPRGEQGPKKGAASERRHDASLCYGLGMVKIVFVLPCCQNSGQRRHAKPLEKAANGGQATNDVEVVEAIHGSGESTDSLCSR